MRNGIVDTGPGQAHGKESETGGKKKENFLWRTIENNPDLTGGRLGAKGDAPIGGEESGPPP